MADQRERVILEVDSSGVATALSSANREVQRFEASAARMGRSWDENMIVKAANLKRNLVPLSDEWKRVDAIQQQAMGRVKAKMDEAGQAMSGFGQKVRDAIQNPMQAAGQAIGGMVDKLGPLGVGLSIGATAFAAIGKAGWDFAKSIGAMGDRIGDTAVRMGLSIREAEGFRFAMNRAGGDMGTLENIMRKLSQEIETGGEHLTEMGVRFRDVQTGELRPMAEMIVELSERLNAMPAGPIRNAAAIKVMGRAALEVLPDLLELSDGLKRFSEMKVGWTDADIAKADEFRKKTAEIEAQWERMILSLKQPVAATFILSVEGWEKLDVLMKFMGLAGKAAVGLGPKVEEPYGPAWAVSRAQHKFDLASIAANDAAVRARLQSTDEEKLSAAKKKLDELGKELPTGVMYSAERFSEFDKQKQIVSAIEARIKATKEFSKALDEMAQGAAKAATEALKDLADQTNKTIENTQRAYEILRANRLSALEYVGEKELTPTVASPTAAWRSRSMELEREAMDKILTDQNEVDEQRIKASERYWEEFQRQAERRFDQIKDAWGGLFDAMLMRSRGFWDAMKNLAYAYFLAPIKDAFGSMLAGAYGGAGGVGRFGGLFGAGAGVTMAQAATGGPGGTSGFAGPVGGGGFGGWGGMLGGLAGLKGMAWNAGSISLGAAGSTTAAGIGGLGGALAGFATSPAGLMSGGMLATSGLMRGGLLGAGLTAGGGALVGAALGSMIFPGIGTALGAGIGALIGGGAGLVRMLFKGASDKAREKIKALYGVDIQSKQILEKIVALAKQGYGGNLDMAIRTQEVRDLIELYAMSTGQGTGGLPARMQPASAVQMSGGLYQQTVTAGNLTPISSGTSAPIVVNAVFDGRTIGSMIVNNGRVVADGALKAAQSNYRRVDSALSTLSPATIRG